MTIVRVAAVALVVALAVMVVPTGAFAGTAITAVSTSALSTSALSTSAMTAAVTAGASTGPAPSASAPPVGPATSRVGGSEPVPGQGKPGWVWWVTGAFVVMLGAGGFRLWRSTVNAGSGSGTGFGSHAGSGDDGDADDADDPAEPVGADRSSHAV